MDSKSFTSLRDHRGRGEGGGDCGAGDDICSENWENHTRTVLILKLNCICLKLSSLMGQWTNSKIHRTATDGPFLHANMSKCTFNPKKEIPYLHSCFNKPNKLHIEYACRSCKHYAILENILPRQRRHHMYATVPARHLQAWMFHASGIILYMLDDVVNCLLF